MLQQSQLTKILDVAREYLRDLIWLTKHIIDIGDTLPVHVMGQRVNPAVNKIIWPELQKMWEVGVVFPSQSPFSFLVIVGKKKDEVICFCMDYWKLNDVTSADTYPVQRIEDSLNCLLGASIGSLCLPMPERVQTEFNEMESHRVASKE